MDNLNLVDFLMNILNGIEYGSLSTTNRAYQWMKNNSSTDGQCLNYLKNYITNENLVTQKEMKIYKKLESERNLPSEEEIDKELEAYLLDSVTEEFEFEDTRNYTNILSHAENYLQALNFVEKYQQRNKTDLEYKIKIEEKRRHSIEQKVTSGLKRSEDLNDLYNEAVKEVLRKLSNLSLTFNKLLSEDSYLEEHTIFRINFEIFKQINSTFRDTVSLVIEKQFGKFPNSKHVGKSGGNGDYTNLDEGVDYSKRGFSVVDKERNKIEMLIGAAMCMGERSFQNVKYQCEEAEYKHMSDFMKDLTQNDSYKDFNFVGNSRLQSQIAVNLETVDDIQKQLTKISESLEQYYKNCVIREIFNEERSRVEHKLKWDKKRLRKVSDLCSKFVDLLTLQAFLLENEKENVDLAIGTYFKGLCLLENQFQRHSETIFNLKQMCRNSDIYNQSNSTDSFTDPSLNLLKVEEIPKQRCNLIEMVQRYTEAIGDQQNKILTFIGHQQKTLLSFKSNVDKINNIIFNGPARQPFFVADLLKEKRLAEQRWAVFNKLFRGLKKDYKKELDRLSTDEYAKIEKSLWITFLFNPKALQDNLKTLRENAGVNKTLILTKRNESCASVFKKPNLSSYH